MNFNAFFKFFLTCLYFFAKTCNAETLALESFSDTEFSTTLQPLDFENTNTSLANSRQRRFSFLPTTFLTFTLFGIKFIARPDTAFDHTTNTTINYKDMGFFQYMTFEADRFLTVFSGKLKFIFISFIIVVILVIIVIIALILLPCSSAVMKTFFGDSLRNILKLFRSFFGRIFRAKAKTASQEAV